MRQTMKKRAAVLAAAAVLLPCGIRASAEGKNVQDAKSLCSGKAMLSASEPAAENLCSFGECSTVRLFDAELQPEDQGNLTDAEFEELKALYEKADAIEAAHADDDSFWEEDNPELDAIWERMEELERMAGWYDDEADDDAELKEALTEAEYQEYLQISARLDEIDELIYEDSDDMTDEEYDSAYAPYEEEMDRLWARLDELYEKAGWYDDEADDDAELKEALTEAEYQEYLQINARLDEIDELIYEDSDDMTDEEYDAAYAPYEEEMDRLWARLDELYEKAGIFCSEEFDGEAVFIDIEHGEYISAINGAELKKE